MTGRGLFFLAIVAALALAAGCAKSRAPRAVKGAVDLTAFDFNREHGAPLEGQWEFHGGKILTPEEARAVPAPAFMHLPGLWEDMTLWSGPPGPMGQATLRLMVKHGSAGEEWALHMPEMNCAYALYIDGIMKSGDGDVTRRGPSDLHKSGPRLVLFSPGGDATEIVLQLGCYNDSRRGLQYPVYVGPLSELTYERDFNQLVDGIIFGFLFFAGFYHVGLFLARKRENAALYFGIFCLLIALRVLTVDENVIDTLFPLISFETGARLEHMTMYLGMPFVSLFIRALFPDEVSRRYVLAILAAGFAAAAATFALPMSVAGRMILPYQVIMLACIAYILFSLILAMKRRRELAAALLAAYVLLSGTVVHDVLNDMKIIDTFFLVPYGMFVMVLLQSYLLAVRYSTAFSRAERLSDELTVSNRVIRDYSENLERMVDERTKVISDQKKHLDEQVDMAERIQQAILPSAIPKLDRALMAYRYVPYMQVGGDFLDYSHDPERGLSLVVFDVSGHGISGAFLASMVKMALAGLWTEHFEDPAGLISALRESMKGKLGGHFISACAVFVDLATGRYRCASAGHPPAILAGSGGEVSLIDIRGSVISDFLPVNYAEHEGRLMPGNSLIVYTDGIIEARSADRVMYDTDRLLRSVSVHSGKEPGDLCDALYDDLVRFLGEGRKNDDDITLVAVRYLG